MTAFQNFMLIFVFFGLIVLPIIFAYWMDDFLKRLKKLQQTLEEFIEDVQE